MLKMSIYLIDDAIYIYKMVVCGSDRFNLLRNNYLLVVQRTPIAVMHQCYRMIGVHKMMVGHLNSFLYWLKASTNVSNFIEWGNLIKWSALFHGKKRLKLSEQLMGDKHFWWNVVRNPSCWKSTTLKY